MRLMLLFLLLVLLPLSVTAQGFGGAVWRGKALHVYDHSPAAWDGVFAQTVADANAMLPGKAPTVIYHRMPPLACGDIPVRRGAVVICQGDPDRWPPDMRHFPGFSFMPHKHRRMTWARVELNERIPVNAPARSALACHELIGHAILGLQDAYDSRQPSESCIHAWADKPGTWDQAVARWLYRKFDQVTRRHRR